ncbi:MAG: hypothetical protein L0G89_11980, partial [Janibacter sp.]|nr:hypothetical protein [Janibacter sp.]
MRLDTSGAAPHTGGVHTLRWRIVVVHSWRRGVPPRLPQAVGWVHGHPQAVAPTGGHRMLEDWIRAPEGLPSGPGRWVARDDDHDGVGEYDAYEPGPPREGVGELTQIVVLRGRVIDVTHEPVSGSGYECAAMEMERVHPSPPPRVERITVREPPHEAMVDWLERVVGGEEALDAL